MNDRHKRFISEYLVDLNATAAAIRAGYSKKTARIQAHQLLGRDDVKAAIGAKQARLADKLDVTAERVVAELAKLGFSNMLDYIRINEDGQPYTDFSALTREQAAAIGEVTVETRTEREIDGEGESISVPVRKVRFKLADKRAALVDLGKHLGLFVERVEHSGAVDVTTNDADVVRRLALIFAKAGKPNA